MGIGKTQGYTGDECRKEISDEGGDEGEEGEEEVKDMGGVFFGIKQENLHVSGDILLGIDISCRCNRRWRAR